MFQAHEMIVGGGEKKNLMISGFQPFEIGVKNLIILVKNWHTKKLTYNTNNEVDQLSYRGMCAYWQSIPGTQPYNPQYQGI